MHVIIDLVYTIEKRALRKPKLRNDAVNSSIYVIFMCILGHFNDLYVVLCFASHCYASFIIEIKSNWCRTGYNAEVNTRLKQFSTDRFSFESKF